MDGDSVSNASYMLAKHVSPPTLGIRTTRIIEPIGGSAANVLWLCQVSARPPWGPVWSSTFISGGPPWAVRSWGGWISPKWRGAGEGCPGGGGAPRNRNTKQAQ